jgi:hypothetical protein
MAFREVAVTEIREVLRAWLAGAGLRRVAEQAGVDRKTARRYVLAAVDAGLARDGGTGPACRTSGPRQRKRYGPNSLPKGGCTSVAA